MGADIAGETDVSRERITKVREHLAVLTSAYLSATFQTQ